MHPILLASLFLWKQSVDDDGDAGTNTDAVLLDPRKSGSDAVIASYKAITGTNVTTGIEEAIRALLKDSSVSSRNVASLMIGTTVGPPLLRTIYCGSDRVGALHQRCD